MPRVVVEGDFTKLHALVDKFRKAAGGRYVSQLQKVLGHEAETQVKLGFRTSTDPYGKPWAHTKWSSPNPLRDTGRLGNSFFSEPTSRGVRVSTNVEYAITHQLGLQITVKNAKALHWTFPRKGGSAGGRRGRTVKGKKGPVVTDFFARTVKIRQRMMVPEAGRTPARWMRAFREATAETMKSILSLHPTT